MTLRDVILALDATSDDLCIVSKRPWTPEADSELTNLTQDHCVPESVKSRGYDYFLEVLIAKEEVLNHTGALLTPDQRVSAVIYYAEFDACPEWLQEICRLHLDS